MVKNHQTARRTQTFFGCREAPRYRIWWKNVLEQVSDVKSKTHARRSRTDENSAAVTESVE